MATTPLLSDLAFAVAEESQEFTVGTHTSTAIDTTAHDADYACVMVNATIGGGATVDCKLQSCASSGGTYADVTSGAITQLAATGTNYVEVAIPAGRPYLKTVTVCGTAVAQGFVVVLLRKRVKT
jgi:hypothetical protein